MNIVERCRILFFPARPEDLELPSEGEVELQASGDGNELAEGDISGESEMDDAGARDTVTTKAEQRSKENRGMIYENRERLVRIDERTAFLTKIVVSFFLAFVVAVGAGLVLAFV